MFGGMSAKERMAQLQAKSSKDAQPAKPPGPGGLKKVGKINGAKDEPAKPSAPEKAKSPEAVKEPAKPKEPEKPKAAEPAKPAEAKKEEKPKEEPKKEPAKPKEEPKPAAAPAADKKPADTKPKDTAVKPKDEPKKPEDKPKDPDKPAEAKKDEKPKEEPKKEPAKPKEEPKPAAAPAADTKPADAKPKEEAKIAADAKPKDTAVKPKDEPKKPEDKPKEPAKPNEEAKKVEPPKPAEAKEAPKPKEEAKPKEEPKKPETKETAKPAEPAKKPEEPAKKQAETKEPAKPKEDAKPAPAPAPAAKKDEPAKTPATEKPKEESKPSAAAAPGKPKEEPKPAAAAPAAQDKPKEAQAATPPKVEAKPAEQPKEAEKKSEQKPQQQAPQPAAAAPSAAAAAKQPETKKPEATAPPPAAAKPEAKPTPPTADTYKPTPDELYAAIFYFSGMGSLLGSALAEGVYVPERNRRTAIDTDEMGGRGTAVAGAGSAVGTNGYRGEAIVATVRSQAHVLSNDFRHLQSLLENMPKFGDPIDASLLPSTASTIKPVDRKAVDQPIHGHMYFQQPARPQPVSGSATAAVGAARPGESATGTAYHQTPTAAAVLAADQQFDGPTVVQLASLTPHPHEGPGSARLAPRGPSPSPQINYTSSVYRPPEPVAATPNASTFAPPSQPWQERYGPEAAGRAQSGPKPYGASGGDVDASGIKPWQLSHLRTLEAKGYRVVTPGIEDQLDGEVRSYAPYLVSDRTMGADRRETLQRAVGSAMTADGYLPSPALAVGRGPSPQHHQHHLPQQPQYRPTSGASYPFSSPSVDNAMPYCDL